MAKPDLSTPEGRIAYKIELMGVARPWRYGGLLMVCAATAMLLWVRFHDLDAFKTPLGLTGVALMVAGWASLFWVIFHCEEHPVDERRYEEGPHTRPWCCPECEKEVAPERLKYAIECRTETAVVFE